MSTVRIPVVLRPHVGGAKEVPATGATVGEVLASVVADHPSLGEQIFTPHGGLHRFVNIYVNGRDARYEGELAAPVAEHDTVILLPAMAGGW